MRSTMRSAVRARTLLVSVALASCLAPRLAGAAADIDFRESRLQHRCVKGPTPAAICCEDADCGLGGTCEVDAAGKISGTLTLVVDDDVSRLDGTSLTGHRLKALTVILETKGKNGAFLAQTFQNLDPNNVQDLVTSLEEGPHDEFGFAVDETLLGQNVDPSGTGIPLDITWLIYRTLDPETVSRMRVNAGMTPTGPETLVVQPAKLKLQRYGNETASGFASVLRVKLATYFVLPKPPQCI
jgi:hypothetical protein